MAYNFNNKKLKDCLIIATITAASSGINNIYAAAFALNEQNASGLGNSYAGRAAIAEDASTSFYNPAGLVFFNKNHQVVGSLNVPIPSLDLRMRRALRGNGSVLTTGDATQDAGDPVLIPAFHMAGPINKDFFYGLSITSPFGLKTEYDKTSRFRYFATLSELKVIDINPNIAYKIDNKWSAAVGLSAQYADITLSRMVDNALLNPAFADGKAENTADGWSWGYNLGLLFQPTKETRLGIAYRSSVLHHVKGNLKTKNIHPVFVAANIIDQKAEGKVRLPESVSLSAFQTISNEWDVMGDITYTHWRRFDNLRIRYNDTALADSIVKEKFKNTVKVSVGANYKYNKDLTFKFGASFDDSPVPTRHRNVRIPDSDRWWLSTGVKYQIDKDTAVDLGYAHLFVKSVDIREFPGGTAPFNNSAAIARVSSSIDILGFQVSYNVV